MFNTKIKKIIVSLFIALALVVPSVRPAKALLPVIDIKRLAEDIAKELASSLTRAFVNRYANKYIGQLLDKYHIRSIVAYGINLKNQVEIEQAMPNDSARDKFIIHSIISDFDRFPGNKIASLGPVFNQDALLAYDIYKNPQRANNAADFQIALANAGNFAGTPYGQQTLRIGQAMAINQIGMNAAMQEIAAGQGNKSQYSCQGLNATNVNDVYDSQDVTKRVGCGIENPAYLINSEITSATNGWWTSNTDPGQDKYSVYAKIISTMASGFIQNRLH